MHKETYWHRSGVNYIDPIKLYIFKVLFEIEPFWLCTWRDNVSSPKLKLLCHPLISLGVCIKSYWSSQSNGIGSRFDEHNKIKCFFLYSSAINTIHRTLCNSVHHSENIYGSGIYPSPNRASSCYNASETPILNIWKFVNLNHNILMLFQYVSSSRCVLLAACYFNLETFAKTY